MKYDKPVLTLIETANAAIKGQIAGSKMGFTLDGRGSSKFVTAAAYEADE